MGKKKPELVRYDFSKPIRITAMRSGGLDTLFYAFLLSLCLTAMILILSLRDGKMHFEFTLWRTLICLPISMVAVVIFQLLRELKTYPPKLSKQAVWTIEELMALTGKGREETERIITRMLESCFVVDASCILEGEQPLAAPSADAASDTEDPSVPSDASESEESAHERGFSKFDS